MIFLQNLPEPHGALFCAMAPFGTWKILRKENRGKAEGKKLWRKIKNGFKI